MSLTSKVAINATALAVGRIAAAGMGIVAVGISTRYLGVANYGDLAAALAFVALVNIVTDLGLWNIGARELAKRPEETQRIVGGLVAIGIAFSLGAAALGAVAAFLIYGGETDDLTRKAILLLLAMAPFSAPLGVASAYFIAKQQAYMGMLGSVISSVVSLVMLVVVVELDLGFTGVVLTYVVALAAQALVVTGLAARKIRIRPTVDRAISGQLFRWALPLGITFVVWGLYWRIDIVLLSVLASHRQVGLYGLAYKLVDALAVFPSFVTITLLPEFARLTERRERLAEIVDKAAGVMQVGALALFVPGVLFAEEIIVLIGGSDFAAAAPVLRLLLVGVALTYVGQVFGQALIALNAQRRLLVMSLLILPANVAFNLILIPVWGASGAALAFALTEVIHLALLLRIYRDFARLPRIRRGARVLAAGCAMAAAAVVKLLPVTGNGGLILTLGLGGALAIALYVGALYALDAMPTEVHTNVVRPLWARLRPRARPAAP
jgi:O-antigen/teichoic acid export membrane protein